MHAVVRTYSGKGAKELFDLLEKRKTDVEKLMRSVKGFVSYSLVRATNGGFSVPSPRTRRARMRASKRRVTGSNRMPPIRARARPQFRRVPSFFN